MANPNITRPVVKERLDTWTKKRSSKQEWLEKRFNEQDTRPDEFPETIVLDKAKPVLLNKPGKKEKKTFSIEYQWKSLHDFNTIKKRWSMRNDVYSDKWQSHHGGKFTTLVGAYSSYKTMKMTTYYDPISGRNWRVRDTATGETFNMI